MHAHKPKSPGVLLVTRAYVASKFFRKHLSEATAIKHAEILIKSSNYNLHYDYPLSALRRLTPAFRLLDGQEQAGKAKELLSVAYYNRGNAMYVIKDYETAIDNYSISISLDPRNIGAYLDRGNASFMLRNYDDAIKDYSKVAFLGLGVVVYSFRASAKFKIGEYKSAVIDYTKMISLRPFDDRVAYEYLNRGRAKACLNRHRGAINDYTAAIRRDYHLASAYAYRADSKAKLNDKKGAKADYLKAAELYKKQGINDLSKKATRYASNQEVSRESYKHKTRDHRHHESHLRVLYQYA
ncbi:MAG: hypothetical protein NT051_01835 [Candidatus Micrarchaeota archaeon]|nr:hypothetical protein [Candidatus Micrarchaeota archaeon]